MEADRLAFIAGQKDSWRWASPQAPGARQRNDTLEKPFFVIEDAIHHCMLKKKKKKAYLFVELSL